MLVSIEWDHTEWMRRSQQILFSRADKFIRNSLKILCPVPLGLCTTGHPKQIWISTKNLCSTFVFSIRIFLFLARDWFAYLRMLKKNNNLKSGCFLTGHSCIAVISLAVSGSNVVTSVSRQCRGCRDFSLVRFPRIGGRNVCTHED